MTYIYLRKKGDLHCEWIVNATRYILEILH